MIDFSKRRFTIRIGRATKHGDQLNRRTSVVGRKTSTRRVSVRNSTALRRAPSAAGGLHRGASVRRSQSGVRRGASVKRAPSAARRNSKRISTLVVEGAPQVTSTPQPAPTANEVPQFASTQVTSPQVTSPTSPKSFFSKLTNRFRGRSKTPKGQPECPSPSPIPILQGPPNGITATLSAANLSPVPPRSPSQRSPSPGSRVTFVDTPVEPATVSEAPADSAANPDPSSPVDTKANTSQLDVPALPAAEVVDGGDDDDGEWVDAEDDEGILEPHTAISPKADAQIDSVHANNVVERNGTPGASFEEHQGTEVPTLAKDPLAVSDGTRLEPTADDQPKAAAQFVPLQVSLLSDLANDTVGADVRISQWLAVTPGAIVGEPENTVEQAQDHANGAETIVLAKRESKQRPRPPQIIVPALASNNPYRTPLPPSPSPSNLGSNLAENNPFRPLVSTQSGLLVEPSTAEDVVPPPSPSILLTPAHEFDDLAGLDFTRKSNDTLTVEGAQVPLPPSPAPSSLSLSPDNDESSPIVASPSDKPTVARASSTSTSGGRSLSTAPSTRGPTTPTSMRFPGHPAFAGFSFGGPSSPGIKVEDSEEGDDERRGRSLEVQGDKRRMRSVSPKLDAVLEGDESRRSSRASLEEVEQPPLSPLPVLEENVKFGKKSTDGDSDSEHEDECGFFAFAERQMEEEKKVAETRLEVPKRSKTMSFLNVGFGKRKSTVGDTPPTPTSPNTVTRSATSSRLLALPAAGPKRSSTLMAPPSGNRVSRLLPGQRSSTLLAEPLSPREALSPTMYTAGDIQAAAGAIEDDESRRLSEAAFMF